MKVISLNTTAPKKVLDIEFYPGSQIKAFYSSINDISLQSRLEKKIYLMGDVQQHRTNIKADMTYWDSHSDPDFLELVGEVVEIIKVISTEFYNSPDINWFVKSCWGAFYKFGEYAVVHDHYPATWAVVYYVRQPENGSCLNFPEPKISIKPKTGSLVIFPGNMKHEVPPLEVKDHRIIISMNIFGI